MHRLAAKLALVAVLVAVPAIGRATVLHVERDGSGDFGTIADAMNAAAVGDTILLGPGFQDNDILKGEGPSVLAEGYVTVPVDIDLSNDYWGTTGADSIAAWVVDGNDLHVPVIDPNFSNVIFEPFLPESTPTQTESMGGLKSRYGRRH